MQLMSKPGNSILWNDLPGPDLIHPHYSKTKNAPHFCEAFCIKDGSERLHHAAHTTHARVTHWHFWFVFFFLC